MEQAKLMGCVDRLVENSNEALKALNGLEMLHRQGEELVLKMDQVEGKTVTLDQIHDHMSKLYTWFDLVRITLNHARDNTNFVQETICEIQTDGFKDLSVIQGGAL